MHWMYISRNEAFPDQTHVGSTSDLRRRPGECNSGKSIHTDKSRFLNLTVYAALLEIHLAEKFEHYLKSGPDGKP